MSQNTKSLFQKMFSHNSPPTYGMNKPSQNCTITRMLFKHFPRQLSAPWQLHVFVYCEGIKTKQIMTV